MKGIIAIVLIIILSLSGCIETTEDKEYDELHEGFYEDIEKEAIDNIDKETIEEIIEEEVEEPIKILECPDGSLVEDISDCPNTFECPDGKIVYDEEDCYEKFDNVTIYTSLHRLSTNAKENEETLFREEYPIGLIAHHVITKRMIKAEVPTIGDITFNCKDLVGKVVCEEDNIHPLVNLNISLEIECIKNSFGLQCDSYLYPYEKYDWKNEEEEILYRTRIEEIRGEGGLYDLFDVNTYLIITLRLAPNSEEIPLDEIELGIKSTQLSVSGLSYNASKFNTENSVKGYTITGNSYSARHLDRFLNSVASSRKTIKIGEMVELWYNTGTKIKPVDTFEITLSQGKGIDESVSFRLINIGSSNRLYP